MSGKTLTTSELVAAIRSGSLSAVINALDAGANIEESDIHGHSGLPLRTACFAGKPEIVAELIRRGADINARGGDGPSQPLRLAVRTRQRAIITLLLEHGARIPDGLEISHEFLASGKTQELPALEMPVAEKPAVQAAKPPAPPKPDLPPLEMTPMEKPEPPAIAEAAPTTYELPPLELTSSATSSPASISAPAEPELAAPDLQLENPELPPLEMSPPARTPAPIDPADFDIIENIDIGRSYGTDTNLLTMDMLRYNEEQEQAAAAAAAPAAQPEAGKSSFWKSGRNIR